MRSFRIHVVAEVAAAIQSDRKLNIGDREGSTFD
jgi:hypothetical protein